MKVSRRTLFISVVIILNIALDQISKVWVRSNVEYGSESPIWTDKFILTKVENKGAFLGMGSELNEAVRIILLLVLPVIVLGIVLRYILKEKSIDRWSLFGYSCIIGGGIANVFDRIVLGSVTDFLHIDLGGVFRTGIFNIADVAVTTGLLIIIFASLFQRKKTV